MKKKVISKKINKKSAISPFSFKRFIEKVSKIPVFNRVGISVLVIAAIVFALTRFDIYLSAQASGSVVPYSSPNAVISTAYALTINGQAVPVEESNGVSYARFATSGNVPIVVTANQSITSSTLSPKHFNIPTQVSGNTISFTLSQPQKLILNVNNGENLLILADPLEVNPPQLGQSNVVNVMNYVIDNTGATLQKTQIQNAIDYVSQMNNGAGGTLYFPNGIYKTGCLLVKSNVTIYLHSGALLQGSANYSDYCNNDTTQPFFLGFDGVNHAGITGRGIIDGAGTSIRNTTDGSNAIFTIETLNNANTIDLEDVLLRNNASWAVHILQSNTVTARNIKIVNPMNIFYLDGIDPDSSSNVTIDGQFTYSTDDCNSVKTSTGYYQVVPSPLPQANNIIIQNGVCYTKSSGFKVGSEINATVTNVTYNNNTTVNAKDAISMLNEFNSIAGAIDGITIANYYTESGVAKLSDFRVSTTTAVVGIINNITVNGLWADTFGDPNNPLDSDPNYNPYWWFESIPDELVMGPDPAHTIGGATYPNQISNITYSNMYVAGTPITTVADAKFMYQFTNNNSVSFITSPLLPTPTPIATPTPTPTPTPVPPTPTPVPYVTVVKSDNPVAYYRLDDTTGTTLSTAVGTLMGSYVNSPLKSQLGSLNSHGNGDSDPSVQFNGTTQYANINYTTALNTTHFSVEAWVYPTGSSLNYWGIASSRVYPKGWTLYVNNNNSLSPYFTFRVNNGSSIVATANTGSGVQLSLDPTTHAVIHKWYHLVATFDGTTERLYVNGSYVASATSSSYSPNNSSKETVGQGEPGSGFYFPGRLDEVAFYNYALDGSTPTSPTHILNHYHAAGY